MDRRIEFMAIFAHLCYTINSVRKGADLYAGKQGTSFAHVLVFGYEVTRVVIVTNDTTLFCESIGIRKSLDGTHFG